MTEEQWTRWGELVTDVQVNGLDGIEPEEVRELAEIAVAFRRSLTMTTAVTVQSLVVR